MVDAGLTFKTVFTTTLVLTLIVSVQGAPADLPQETGKNCSDSDGSKGEENKENLIIDQHQSGGGNFRINVKDVLVVWAPAKSLLTAASSGALLYPMMLGELLVGGAAASALYKPQEAQNQEQSPIILEVIETKPLEQDSSMTKPSEGEDQKEPETSSSTTKLPENEGEKKPTMSPATKPADLQRSALNYSFLGPFLKRKQQV